MKDTGWLSLAVLALHQTLWAQAAGGTAGIPAKTTEQLPADRPGLFSVELGGFTNFVNNNYGHWNGGSGRLTYLRGNRFTPSFGFATQKRPEGSQSTLGVDSYIGVTKWLYLTAGVGGSPDGTANLFPKLSYGVTGMISMPWPKGLVGSLGAAQIHGKDESYGRVLTTGLLYYRGRTISSAYFSFNRSYPGAVPSNSGSLGIQYGNDKNYWIGVAMSGGRIAYQLIALQPLDVRFKTFGPNVFFQKWITNKWGFIAKYDYQNQLDAFQRHGLAMNIFFEVP